MRYISMHTENAKKIIKNNVAAKCLRNRDLNLSQKEKIKILPKNIFYFKKNIYFQRRF